MASPATVWIKIGVVVIIIAFGGFGTWAALAPLDSAAIAPGVVVVEGNRKTVQHLEGGIVKEILVRDGDIVHSDDLLLRLEDTHARALYDILSGEDDATQALAARLEAERGGAKKIQFPEYVLARADVPAVSKILRGQLQLFKARRNSLSGQIAILEQRIAQFKEKIAGLKAEEQAREVQLTILKDQLIDLRNGLKEGTVSRNEVLAFRRQVAELTGERGRFMADVASAQQGIGEASLQIVQVRKNFREKVVAELREVQDNLFILSERLVAAKDALDRTKIRAPVGGVIMNLQVHTAGGVIAPGEELLQIVPGGERLVIEAQIDPMDIDDVEVGQEATVRLTAFRFRTTPIVIGTLVNVSADRMVDDQTNIAYYLARIHVPPEQLALLGNLTLQPGMPVEALIKTGTRTALTYLLSPIKDSLARSFREK
jgi:HlyD family secretion protein/epimerase transport system membrane fusion protein